MADSREVEVRCWVHWPKKVERAAVLVIQEAEESRVAARYS